MGVVLNRDGLVTRLELPVGAGHAGIPKSD